jgi:hypothetical protein
MYEIVENDVRLLRRVLVAYNVGDKDSADRIVRHLREKGLVFVLPKDQTEEQYSGYKSRLPVNEQWLCDHYGAILLPDYFDIIFLNSKWVNPYTLYVRLTEEVPELGDLGKKHWIPKAIGGETEFRPAAEKMHERYLRGLRGILQKIFHQG